MNAVDPSSPPDLRRIGAQALSEVLDTLLSLSVTELIETPVLADELPNHRILGLVRLSGDRLSGDVRLQVPAEFAKLAASRLWRNDGAEEHPAGSCLDDLTGELCNMIAGRVAAGLRQEGYVSELAPPVVGRGFHRLPEPATGGGQCRTFWSCESHLLTLEIQCQYRSA